jgi:hypothetical protein
VIDLVDQNKALLFKHLHKFFNKPDAPWVDLTWKAHYTVALAPQARNPRGSFWWKALCRLFDQYRAVSKAVVSGSFWWKALCRLFDQYREISKAVVSIGDTTMFWRDIWNFGSLQQLYAHLFSFVKDPNYSVQCFLSLLPEYDGIFQLPLSIEASHQLAELGDSLTEWNRESNANGQGVYIRGSGIFTSKQAYSSMKGHSQAPAPLGYGNQGVKVNTVCSSGFC